MTAVRAPPILNSPAAAIRSFIQRQGQPRGLGVKKQYDHPLRNEARERRTSLFGWRKSRALSIGTNGKPRRGLCARQGLLPDLDNLGGNIVVGEYGDITDTLWFG
jgi:hypothetical protein